VETKGSEGATVAAAFIKFKGLLFEMGISPHAGEEQLHDLAHEQCFIANSIKTEVSVIRPEPTASG
jgi:organic hydroperoxide reductase OsmC/OhrA